MNTSAKRPGIHFHEIKRNPSLRNRKLLKQFILRMFKSERRGLGELNVIFCSDEYLLKMNKEYLHHETYTDIITFDLSDNPHKIAGEIYISLDRVRDNASSYETPVATETLRVIFHGILHLCGYGDKTPGDQTLMRSMEDRYLNRYRRFVSRETRST